MKAKPLPRVEAESLELARIVTRERELLAEMEQLKIDKRRVLANIQQFAGSPTLAESEPKTDSKKDRVRKEVFERELGSEITTGDIATAVAIDPDVVSNYLSGMAKDGYLRRSGRGKYVIERTVM